MLTIHIQNKSQCIVHTVVWDLQVRDYFDFMGMFDRSSLLLLWCFRLYIYGVDLHFAVLINISVGSLICNRITKLLRNIKAKCHVQLTVLACLECYPLWLNYYKPINNLRRHSIMNSKCSYYLSPIGYTQCKIQILNNLGSILLVCEPNTYLKDITSPIPQNSITHAHNRNYNSNRKSQQIGMDIVCIPK